MSNDLARLRCERKICSDSMTTLDTGIASEQLGTGVGTDAAGYCNRDEHLTANYETGGRGKEKSRRCFYNYDFTQCKGIAHGDTCR